MNERTNERTNQPTNQQINLWKQKGHLATDIAMLQNSK